MQLEWVHLSWGTPIPPTHDGSYNHLIWDIIQRRHGRDLLIAEYYPEAYEQIRQSTHAVVYIEQLHESRLMYRMRRLWNRAKRRLTVPLYLEQAAKIIQASGCQKVLVWDWIANLPAIRQLLPDQTLVYAQRHYDYPDSSLHYNKCDILITQTRGQTRLAFERMYRLEPYVLTIPNGVELNTFRPATSDERRSIRNRLGLPEDRLILIFPSKLAPYKGTRYLLRWIEAHQNAHFLVIGKLHFTLTANHQRELESALKNGINVTWIGGCPRTEMPEYYKAADVCLMPGVWREGFSMAAIEAMASGLPLIASNAGFYPEVVRNEYNGFLCRQEYLFDDVSNAIHRLQTDPSLLDTMSSNARYYAEKRLSREKVLTNFDAFLEGRYQDIDDDLSIPE